MKLFHPPNFQSDHFKSVIDEYGLKRGFFSNICYLVNLHGS